MNMHLPQSIEAMTELRMLAAVPKQIIIAKNNAPVIAAVQDSVVGVYRMTHNDFVVSRAKDAGDPLKIHLAARDVMNIMMAIKGFRGPLPPPTIPASNPENRTGIDLWSGKDIFHAILPGMFVDMKTDFGRVKISPKGYENREGVDAPIDVGVLNKGSRGIVHQVFLDKGSDACSDFLDNLQNIIVMFLIQSGFSVGLSDLIADNETNDKILDIIRSKKEEVARIIRSIHNGTFENKTSRSNQSVFEERVNSILNSAINEAGKVGTKSLAWNNRMTNMVKAGSKGKTLNIAQMMACVGQVNVDGQRIPYGFEGRTLPHFQRYDDSPEARGFVENSFVRGLTPTEFFFHAQSGREGLIDTAVKTSATGYVQRQMVKAMEDLKVHYDQTVRTANGAIVQMAYGEDGMDSTRVIAQVVPSLEQTVYDIYSTNAFREDDTLEDFLTPTVASKVREQLPVLIERTRKLAEKIVEDRDSILDSAGEKISAVNYPIPFERIITEITGAMRGDVGIFSNLSPMEVLDWMDELEKETRLNAVFGSNDMFMALARVFLSPRVLIRDKRVTREQFMMIILRIRTYFEKSLVHPGEMVGVVSAQSIGEPATQMTLNTFHLSGVAEKSNVTRGVPRLNEILHLSKNLKSPSVTVFLEGASMTDRAAADVIRKKLVRTKVSDVVKRLRIAYDPRNYATTLGVVRPVYHWKLQLIMDAEEMHERDITMEDVHIAIAKGLGGKFGEVLVQSSDMNADELVVALSVATAGEIADEDSGDAIRLLRDLETLVIEKVVVRGIRGIEHCVLRKMPPTMVKVDQEYQNIEQYVVDTVGTNLLEILGTPGVDQRRTFSNHILEINQVLGIDAARNSIIRELQDVFETYINYHHLSLLADKMTSRGIPISIDRHGVNKSDSGPLAKASFEETDTVLLNAAQMGELDPVTGVTANIMFGQPIPGGTGMSQILLDEDMFLKVFRPPKAVSEEDRAMGAAREEEERKAAYCENKDIRLHRLDTKGVSMVAAGGWMEDDVDF